MTASAELDAAVIILLVLVVVVMWVGVEVQRLHATLEPLVNSTALRTLASV